LSADPLSNTPSLPASSFQRPVSSASASKARGSKRSSTIRRNHNTNFRGLRIGVQNQEGTEALLS
jgi:hypothetical protein